MTKFFQFSYKFWRQNWVTLWREVSQGIPHSLLHHGLDWLTIHTSQSTEKPRDRTFFSFSLNTSLRTGAWGTEGSHSLGSGNGSTGSPEHSSFNDDIPGTCVWAYPPSGRVCKGHKEGGMKTPYVFPRLLGQRRLSKSSRLCWVPPSRFLVIIYWPRKFVDGIQSTGVACRILKRLFCLLWWVVHVFSLCHDL